MKGAKEKKIYFKMKNRMKKKKTKEES